MKQIELGGKSRLGSGNKMDVTLPTFNRSNHNLSYIWRSSMSAGTLVPFMCEVALPGDTWDIQLDVDVKTLPTEGPLFGSFKVQLDLFTAPIRLYNKFLYMNKNEIGLNMSAVKLPIMKWTVEPAFGKVDSVPINSSCILKYLGLSGFGITGQTAVRSFNGVPLLAYWEIYKNYYANKVEGKGAVIHMDAVAMDEEVEEIKFVDAESVIPLFPDEANYRPIRNNQLNQQIQITFFTGANKNYQSLYFYLSGYGWVLFDELAEPNSIIVIGDQVFFSVKQQYINCYIRNYQWAWNLNNQPYTNEINIVTFDLDNIDTMRERIMVGATDPFDISAQNLTPYQYLFQNNANAPFTRFSQEGLGIKTYQSDVFNNWLDTAWIDAINTQTAVAVVGGSFKIDQLILSKKIYEMLNGVAVSGGSYGDWIGAVYDHNYIMRATNPVYEGGLIRELAFQEIVSNAATEDEPLASLAGKGVMTEKKKGGSCIIKTDEHSYIIGIVSLTPRIDYSQGNRWDVNLKTMDDFHKPQLDGIGFQDLILEQAAWWSTRYNGTTWKQKAAGKQPAWINYMTNYNRTYGAFAEDENSMFMTLNRRYEPADVNGNIKDFTTYIDPSKYNFIFSQTTIDSQNFWVQIGCNIMARRKMSAKIIPNL